jgi:hypothetical protein
MGHKNKSKVRFLIGVFLATKAVSALAEAVFLLFSFFWVLSRGGTIKLFLLPAPHLAVVAHCNTCNSIVPGHKDTKALRSATYLPAIGMFIIMQAFARPFF